MKIYTLNYRTTPRNDWRSLKTYFSFEDVVKGLNHVKSEGRSFTEYKIVERVEHESSHLLISCLNSKLDKTMWRTLTDAISAAHIDNSVMFHIKRMDDHDNFFQGNYRNYEEYLKYNWEDHPEYREE